MSAAPHDTTAAGDHRGARCGIDVHARLVWAAVVVAAVAAVLTAETLPVAQALPPHVARVFAVAGLLLAVGLVLLAARRVLGDVLDLAAAPAGALAAAVSVTGAIRALSALALAVMPTAGRWTSLLAPLVFFAGVIWFCRDRATDSGCFRCRRVVSPAGLLAVGLFLALSELVTP